MAASLLHSGATTTFIRRIAVAGNPNSGKTTVFNRLTGLRQRVANYAGVTVEKREALLSGTDIVLLDLPGTYSLCARSPDEIIARDVLLGRQSDTPRPDGILLVIDASNLERNLYLASQIIEFGTPVVIACNMVDVAESRGHVIDTAALSVELGVEVIPTSAKLGRGIREIHDALVRLPPAARERPDVSPRRWRLPVSFESAVEHAAGVIAQSGAVPAHAARAGALLWLTDYLSDEAAGTTPAERFLTRLSSDDAEALRGIARKVGSDVPDTAASVIEARYQWIAEIVRRVVRKSGDTTGACAEADIVESEATTISDRIDRIVTHRVLGFFVFALVMAMLFLSIFSGAEPLMNLIETGMIALAGGIRGVIPEGPVQSLLADGVVSGVGAVIVFFPQICILFLFLSILEDSGYMARAAFLMDRVMCRVGLHGRSFIPLLSSYACAIPGIMATRTIENPRDRLTTILIAPLMSCSARLPVYVILIAAIFGDQVWLKTAVMFGLYLLGTVTALVMAVIFKSTLLKGPTPTFIMELPPYHMPQARVILRTMWDRSKMFLTGAGTTIFAACIVIWALSYFPRLDVNALPPDLQPHSTDPSMAAIANAGADSARVADFKTDSGRGAPTLNIEEADALRRNRLAGEQLRQSILGRLGHLIEPAIRPLGYDWRLGVGILSSFLAREVFVGSMAITFSIGDADESSDALREKLAMATWPDGRRVLTPRVGISLMVFYVLACQCVSTLAVVKRETGTWMWPFFMFCYMTLLAYGASFGINQIGALLGWGG